MRHYSLKSFAGGAVCKKWLNVGADLKYFINFVIVNGDTGCLDWENVWPGGCMLLFVSVLEIISHI